MLQDIDTKHKAVAGSYGKKVLKSVLGSDTDTSSSEMESKEQNSVQVLQEKVELLEDWVQKQVRRDLLSFYRLNPLIPSPFISLAYFYLD